MRCTGRNSRSGLSQKKALLETLGNDETILKLKTFKNANEELNVRTVVGFQSTVSDIKTEFLYRHFPEFDQVLLKRFSKTFLNSSF